MAEQRHEETAMDNHPTRRSLFVLRLIVGLALLGWPRVGSAAGTWSIIPFPVKLGEVFSPSALAVDAAGNLYVGDRRVGIQKRDTEEHWSVIAGVAQSPGALAVDSAGNLYVPDYYGGIQKRDAQGNWSVIATQGADLGQVLGPTALAVDTAGNLYVVDYGNGDKGRVQKRDVHGTWTMIAANGSNLGQVIGPAALAVDSADNLYVADSYYDTARTYHARIQKRDAQGNWSVIAIAGSALGHVNGPIALAIDTAGSLYIVDWEQMAAGGIAPRIQKRDAQGHWSIIATVGAALGELRGPNALAVDTVGNLYVAESGYDYDYSPGRYIGGRIQKWDAQGNWSLIATVGNEPTELLDPLRQELSPFGIAVDRAGSIYVTDRGCSCILKRDGQGNWSVIATQGASALAVDTAGYLYAVTGAGIQKRDAQGNWSVIATQGTALGQVNATAALAVDIAGDLYVADLHDYSDGRIQKRDAQGNWSVIATGGTATGQVYGPTALAVDAAGSLYVAEYYSSFGGSWSRIQKRDAQGNWSVIAASGFDPGQVHRATALVADAGGNLYVADRDASGNVRIQKRDAHGNWSVIATQGILLDQDADVSGLAVDTAGNLYVADPDNIRVLMYTPGP
jgi:sugar lactone lactonase YvrE